VVHPITGKRVPLTPELRAHLEKEEPKLMESIREKATCAAAQNQPAPVDRPRAAIFDASKFQD
jgi:hypothetical protein